MINRFRTRCLTCGHRNTLRITLGTDTRQEHTFACPGCGESIKVVLDIDFVNRQHFEPMPNISFPTSEFHCIENCELCEEEGTITNLDPNFLISQDLLHQDQVFSWMDQAKKIGFINEPEDVKGKVNDVIAGVGGQRNFRVIISSFVKAWNLFSRGQSELCRNQLDVMEASLGNKIRSVDEAAVMLAVVFLGQSREDEISIIYQELDKCISANELEYRQFRGWLFSERLFDDLMRRHVNILSEYLSAYDQLFQTWIYVSRNVPIDGGLIATSKDIRNVKMFYGNVFEELSAGLLLPACLNNIKSGRSYNQFLDMDLKKYLTINKAGRAKPFGSNAGFNSLHDEFDSVIRNASHHGAIHRSKESEDFIEYRSGDSGGWKKMNYAGYLVKCNRIMFCLMRLLVLQIAIKHG